MPRTERDASSTRFEILETIFGWTGEQADWIVLACLHSGVFIRGQLCLHFQADRWKALRFVRALID